MTHRLERDWFQALNLSSEKQVTSLCFQNATCTATLRCWSHSLLKLNLIKVLLKTKINSRHKKCCLKNNRQPIGATFSCCELRLLEPNHNTKPFTTTQSTAIARGRAPCLLDDLNKSISTRCPLWNLFTLYLQNRESSIYI